MASKPPTKFKVAIIQMRPKPLDPDANFSHAASEIRTAASQGASLAILPEYHLSGWEPNNPKFATIARDAHKYQEGYQSLAAELHINICTGTIVQTPRDAAANPEGKPVLLNISAFISSNGELLGTYIKTNIWIPERPHLTSSVVYANASPSPSGKNLTHAGVAHSEPDPSPSAVHPIIDTPLGKVGLLICWDLAFPEAFRQLLNQDVQLILIPTYWTKFDMSAAGLKLNEHAERLFLESTLVARAFENTCTIVFCNAGGPVEEGFLGLSGVYQPILGRVGGFDGPDEQTRVVELDLDVQRVAEENYQVRKDLKGEEWHYGYEKK